MACQSEKLVELMVHTSRQTSSVSSWGSQKKNPKLVLNKHNEDEIATWLKEITICGFPMKPDNLLNIVQQITIEDGRPNLSKWKTKKEIGEFFFSTQ